MDGSSPANQRNRRCGESKILTRTRTGCLNCRRKKRKCDERRPTCGACGRQGIHCPWGLKISFRDANALAIDGGHPSMKRATKKRAQEFEILDVTAEVVREHHAQSPEADIGTDHVGSNLGAKTSSNSRHQVARQSSPEAASLGSTLSSSSKRLEAPTTSPQPCQDLSTSTRHTHPAVSDFAYPNQAEEAQVFSYHQLEALFGSVPVDGGADHLGNVQAFTPEGSLEDGIFLPGSTYHELHSTLRNRLIQEVKSNAPTRPSTPIGSERDVSNAGDDEAFVRPTELSPDSGSSFLLGKEEEIALWRNWFDEIAPWLDKFDVDCHFQHIIPTMAASDSHLRYAMLALSARQVELKQTTKPTDKSLRLYQEAIHLLLPHLPTRSTAVIASCVILCVLEMLSCSPKAWRRHLDGCASMMEAVGINGFVGGVEEALFWCFARMDVCGGLISSVTTLIPTSHWASKLDLDADVDMFRSRHRFDNWANYAVYLVAQVLDLLALASTALFKDHGPADPKYGTRWLRLWKYVSDWYNLRPAPLHPVITMPSSDTSPFPTILFANAAAISGTQLYHTASILMLQNQPAGLRLTPKPRGVLWHARQICAISISNHHHGAWTNSIQPLWIAGRCMSHPAEHKAILELLEKIEKVSGWGTRWRAEDLKEFWGDLGE